MKDIPYTYKCLYNILFRSEFRWPIRRFNYHIKDIVYRNTLESKQLKDLCWYFTTGYESISKFSISGWGKQYTLTSSSLPQGVSFESNTLTLEYDGINSIASNITVYAASITNNFSVDVGLESFEFSKIQGRIDSLSLDSGFNSGDTFEDISIKAGFHHSCLKIEHKLRCWGYNAHGQMGEVALQPTKLIRGCLFR